MAETRKVKRKKKKTPFLNDLPFLQLVRLIVIILLACFLVYLYYLQTKGILISTIASRWKQHQKTIEVILGITAYSSVVFYLGYKKGRKR
jgi:uncharacterized membrane protein